MIIISFKVRLVILNVKILSFFHHSSVLSFFFSLGWVFSSGQRVRRVVLLQASRPEGDAAAVTWFCSRSLKILILYVQIHILNIFITHIYTTHIHIKCKKNNKKLNRRVATYSNNMQSSKGCFFADLAHSLGAPVAGPTLSSLLKKF